MEQENMLTGVNYIAYERAHQIQKFGYTVEHDVQHGSEMLINAAEAYLQPCIGEIRDVDNGFDEKIEQVLIPNSWPFEDNSWKGSDDDRITQLSKAGAFIAAAIDQLLKEKT